MIKITIKAKAGETNCPSNRINELDGIDCQDNFVDYSDLADKLESGYMRFKVEGEVLHTITEYEANTLLSEEELIQLGEETQGQWSDGIGEGFEQRSCIEIDDEEIFISPWYSGQVLDIKQEQL